MSRYLLIDTQFMAYRAFHTTGGLSHDGKATGVLYGILRDISNIIGWYQPTATAWCFDSKVNNRKEIDPEYKSRRKKPEGHLDLYDEIKELRTVHLPELGFRNIFVQRGYEADDIIASLAANIHFADEAIIVAADKDLYQCLNQTVRMFNPIKKKEYTVQDFTKQWGIPPSSWARCKAIAGCSTDNIKGVPGVAERTAIKWLKGDIEPKSKIGRRILDNLDRVNRNYDIVHLPLEGTKTFEWSKDKITRKRWRRVAKRNGMKSLLVECPFP